MNIPHTSVLLNELLDFFKDKQLNYFIDATLGAGGHSYAFLKAHPEIKCLIGIDQDPIARNIAQERLTEWNQKFLIIPANFSNLKNHLKTLGINQVNGIIFDLGVSSMQFDMPEKGFSLMRDGPLDMRMDPTNSLTAAIIVNEWPEEKLGRLFRDYGEEKKWRAAARQIVAARKEKPITTTFELVEVIKKAIPFTKKGIHPATLIFQALRICVNAELDVLEKAIPEAIELLEQGGRLGVISFHSLEDRIVKNIFRFAASDKYDTAGIGGVFLDKDPVITLVTRKPVIPSEKEMRENPRSRSAKLRVVEKK